MSALSNLEMSAFFLLLDNHKRSFQGGRLFDDRRTFDNEYKRSRTCDGCEAGNRQAAKTKRSSEAVKFINASTKTVDEEISSFRYCGLDIQTTGLEQSLSSRCRKNKYRDAGAQTL